jgi:predicted nuclease with TOPRIM domain
MDKEMKGYFDQKLLGLATKDDVEKLRQETKANFRQLKEDSKTNLAEWRQETQSAFDQSNLQRIKEVERIGEQIKQMAEEVAALHGKIKEGFTEVKEELGSMIKFSYADLEKKINALEVRIKALEKMVFP